MLWAISCDIFFFIWLALRSSFSFKDLQKSTEQCPQSSETNSTFCAFGVRQRNQNYPTNAANKNTKLRIHRKKSTIVQYYQACCRHLSVPQSVILLSKVESTTTMHENRKTMKLETAYLDQKMNQSGISIIWTHWDQAKQSGQSRVRIIENININEEQNYLN